MSGGGDSGGGGGTTSTVTTQKSDPWAEQKPFLLSGMEFAQKNILNRPTQFYPGQTVVPFSPETEASLSGTTNRALAGSPVMGAANQEAMKTLSGDYLGANPFLGRAIEGAIRPLSEQYFQSARPAMERGFAMGGRYGSGAMEGALGRSDDRFMRTAGDIASQMASQDYGRERDAMLKSQLLAPNLASQDYQDMAQLAQVGAARENLAQQMLGSDIARFQYSELEPIQRAQYYMPLVQGNFGGTTSGTTSGNVNQRSPAVDPFMFGAGALLGTLPFIGSIF